MQSGLLCPLQEVAGGPQGITRDLHWREEVRFWSPSSFPWGSTGVPLAMANWVAWGVPCILKSLAGMIERERTSRNWRGILYCAVSLWFESWLHSEVLGKAHSQAEGPFSCRDTSCLWGKGYQWRLFASVHKNEVLVLEEFIDFKKERMK